MAVSRSQSIQWSACPTRGGTLALRLLAACLMLPLAFSPADSARAQLPAARLDSLTPLSGNAGQTVEVTLYGSDLDGVEALEFSHPGIKAARKMAEPGPFDKGPRPVAGQFVVTLAGNVPVGRYEVRAIGKYGTSNAHSFFVSTLPPVAEVEPNQDGETATPLELPVDVSGVLDATGDVDWFRFTAPASQRLILDCYARRADSQADAVVVVYDARGREIGNSRDGHRGDPLVDVNVAAGQSYLVKV